MSITLTPAEFQLDSMPMTNVGSPVTLAGIQRWRDAVLEAFGSGYPPLFVDAKLLRDIEDDRAYTARCEAIMIRMQGLNSRALRLLHSRGMRVSKRNYRLACAAISRPHLKQ